jgi:hypothetical protein
MDFYPPLSERSDKELFDIISNDDKWQEEIQRLANDELKNRHYSLDKIIDEKKRRKKIISNYVDREQMMRQRNAIESYTLKEMLFFILTFPFFLIVGHLFHINPFQKFAELEKGNYKKKFRQRIMLIVLSISVWYLCGRLIYSIT